MLRIRILAALCLIFSAAGFAQTWPEPNCAKSPKLFEEQYADVVRAYKKGDDQAMKTALEVFTLPENWFTTHFGTDIGQELSKAYAEQFVYFEWDTLRHFHWIDRADDSTTETEVFVGPHPKPPPKPAPVSLTSIPEIKMFMIRFTKQHGTFEMFGRPDRLAHAVSWGNLYAEVDGRYRFFGLGGYPFWDLPHMALADMCGKPGEKGPGGELVKRIEPDYQEARGLAARSGTVSMRLTVSKEGSVTDVEIIDGDPILVPAAKAAVMQWRYTPWMNCGQPVEVRTRESIKFTPPS